MRHENEKRCENEKTMLSWGDTRWDEIQDEMKTEGMRKNEHQKRQNMRNWKSSMRKQKKSTRQQEMRRKNKKKQTRYVRKAETRWDVKMWKWVKTSENWDEKYEKNNEKKGDVRENKKTKRWEEHETKKNLERSLRKEKKTKGLMRIKDVNVIITIRGEKRRGGLRRNRWLPRLKKMTEDLF